MYTAPEQGRQTPGDKILMSTERFYHFTDLLQVNRWSRTNGLVANKIPEFMIIKNLLQIDLHVHKFSEAYFSLFFSMWHQSFVATAPPPTPMKMGGANVWGSDLLSSPVRAGLVILCKYTPIEFTIINSGAMTLSRSPQCRAFSRAVIDEKWLPRYSP